MTYEDAYYHKLLLQFGFDGGYDAWLDGWLEAENPLSDIVLALADCGSDRNRTVSVLHNFYLNQKIDEPAVCDRLRLFLKEEYLAGRMDRNAVLKAMVTFASAHEYPCCDPWYSMYVLYWHHRESTETGWFSEKSFMPIFEAYLLEGIPYPNPAAAGCTKPV